MMRVPTLLLALLLALSASAAPVGDALDRPALQVRRPAQVVLLAVAQAGDRLVAVGERGVIAISGDQGQSWRQVPCPVSVTLTQVRFADARHGVAVGHGGTVLATSDGGQHWEPRLDGRRLAQLALDAARSAGDATRVRDAERLLADGPDKPLLDVAIWNAQRWMVVGAYGIALRTEDGGRSWRPWMEHLPNPRGLHLYALRRHGATLLLAGEQGLLLRSDDDGASFRALASPYRGSWFAAEMLPSGEWVLAGLRGNAWRSADGGATWSALAVPMPASITGMTLARQGRLLFVNQAGHVLQRDGERLTPLNRTALPPLAGVTALADGRLLAYGLAGVRRLDGPGGAAR
ncbi:MAG: hypothetical protein KIT17_24085 [Rubrivivax sp.]|nr:hypothetical protein [Rubrivivax sp.]